MKTKIIQILVIKIVKLYPKLTNKDKLYVNFKEVLGEVEKFSMTATRPAHYVLVKILKFHLVQFGQ
jgi:hypothetical protein